MVKPTKREDITTTWIIPVPLSVEAWNTLVDASRNEDKIFLVLESPSGEQSLQLDLRVWEKLKHE